jgi:protein TonB
MELENKFLANWGHVVLSVGIHLLLALFLWNPNFIKEEEKAIEVDLEYFKPPARKSEEVRKIHPKQIVVQEERANKQVDQKTNLLSAFDQKVQKETQAAHGGNFKNAEKDAGHEVSRDISSDFAIKKGQGNEAQQSSTSDYLKDIDKGMKTILNTREFTYYNYYNKIRIALEKHWEPKVRKRIKIQQKKIEDETGPTDGRVTRILVTLDHNGELLSVTVLRASGVDGFDSAAQEAFREAAPFPDPPNGIVDVSGKIQIRWDFVLSML